MGSTAVPVDPAEGEDRRSALGEGRCSTIGRTLLLSFFLSCLLACLLVEGGSRVT